MSDPGSNPGAPPPPDAASPALPSTGPQPAVSRPPGLDFRIGDEFGTAKRNLPPARIVLISIVAVAVVVGIIAFVQRAKPQGAGSINFVSAVDVPGQNRVLVAITFTLRNTTDKSLWVHTLKGELTTADGHAYEDEAASAVDLDRYYQLFPALKESSEPPISPETKLPPGTEKRGTILVSFPLSSHQFDARKMLTVTIQPYDQPVAVVLH